MTFQAFLKHLIFCLGLAAVSALVVRATIDARVMDQPDARKAHVHATPKGGGVGIVVAFMLGMAVLYGFAAFSRIAHTRHANNTATSNTLATCSPIGDGSADSSHGRAASSVFSHSPSVIRSSGFASGYTWNALPKIACRKAK